MSKDICVGVKDVQVPLCQKGKGSDQNMQTILRIPKPRE
jgi:hypothetical protein